MTSRPLVAGSAGFALIVGLTLPALAQINVGFPGPGGAGVPAGRNYDTPAALRLQVTPRQTQVFVDGYYAGIVDDFDGAFQRLDLQPGQHDIQLFLPGYRLHDEQIYLQPGNTFKVKFTMEKLGPGEPEPERPVASPRTQAGPQQRGGASPRPPAPPTGPVATAGGPPSRDDGSSRAPAGSVSIRVQPVDAQILIDGTAWDRGSEDEALVVQLSPGPHTIEARKSGYRGYLTEVTVRSSATLPVNISLSPAR